MTCMILCGAVLYAISWIGTFCVCYQLDDGEHPWYCAVTALFGPLLFPGLAAAMVALMLFNSVQKTWFDLRNTGRRRG